MTGPRRRDRPGGDFSLARLALTSLGAATVVLIATAAIVVLLRPAPVVGLIIALVGVVVAVAVMGVISTRVTRRAFGSDPDLPER